MSWHTYYIVEEEDVENHEPEAELPSTVISFGGAAGAQPAPSGTPQWAEAEILQRTLDGHSAKVTSVTFHPSGGTLASGSTDNTIKIWRFADGALLRTLEGHSNDVKSVAFDPSGGTLASGSDDQTVKLW
eukprot:SAG31_NODE_6311_length_2070_cov_1.570269_1_plen_129_part_10